MRLTRVFIAGILVLRDGNSGIERNSNLAEHRTNLEFVLTTPLSEKSFDSLEKLDAAFDAAVREFAYRGSYQVYATTYGKACGQGIGKAHAYRLFDGRIFRRPLNDWSNSEMIEEGGVK